MLTSTAAASTKVDLASENFIFQLWVVGNIGGAMNGNSNDVTAFTTHLFMLYESHMRSPNLFLPGLFFYYTIFSSLLRRGLLWPLGERF